MPEFRESWQESDDGPPRSRTPEVSAWSDGSGTSDGWPPADGSDVPDTTADRRRAAAPDLGWLAMGGAEHGDDGPDHGRPTPDVPDLDIDQLRRAPAERERFSDPEICWVPVDLVESTDAVRGEGFKDGTDPARYAAELAELQRRHAAGDAELELDARHSGDHRIRLCEDPDTGELTVTNGRHRIQAAREAGVPAVVAEVVVARDAPAGQPADALSAWAHGRTGDITYGSVLTENSHRTIWARDGQGGDRHSTTELVDGVLRFRTHEDGILEGWEENLESGEVTRFRRRGR